MRSLLTVSFVFGLLPLVGCRDAGTGPAMLNLDGLPEGLVLELALTPDRVHPHQPFVAVFQARNVSADTLRVTTPHSCLVVPGVYRGEQRIPFVGSWYGCLTVITTHVFEPGETRTFVWEMRAELYGEHPGDPEGVPAPPGHYLVRAELEWRNEDGSRPGVGAPLRVR